jgi:hypothetical protein
VQEALRGLARAADRRVYPISAVTGAGLEDLLGAIAEAMASAPPPPEVPDRADP